MFSSAAPRRVKADMVALRGADNDIVRLIVCLIAIDMVNNLTVGQIATEFPLSHEAMLIYASVLICARMAIWGNDADVAILSQRATAIPAGVLVSALMMSKYIQWAFQASADNKSPASTTTFSCDGTIASLRICQKSSPIFQVIRTVIGPSLGSCHKSHCNTPRMWRRA